MTPWLIFGGGGNGVGSLVLSLALEQRRPVVALARNAQVVAALRQRGVHAEQGDACDEQAVEKVCQAAGASALIISTMGGGQEYNAHRTVIDTAWRYGIRRMILVTSLGCGDGWAYLSERAKATFGQSVRQKNLAESWLQTSGMDYLILRPGGLLNGAATGLAQLYQQPDVHGFVNRADVAHRVSQLAAEPALNGRIYSLIQPDLRPERKG